MQRSAGVLHKVTGTPSTSTVLLPTLENVFGSSTVHTYCTLSLLVQRFVVYIVSQAMSKVMPNLLV
jgi:hypothetical protein